MVDASTTIKICGLTRPSDVEAAIAAGADMLGFVFDRGPCCVSRDTGQALLAVARAAGPRRCCVAVVGTLAGPARAAIGLLGFDALQMEATAFAPEATGVEGAAWALPAFFDDGRLEDRVRAFRRAHHPRFSELDPDTGLRGLINVDGRGGGGTGARTDFQAAASLARSGPLMLAGGLTPDNVGEAIARVRPHAVDVSSGVERAPGEKDPERLRAFVTAVHAAGRACQDRAGV